jgi:hypothetical protein
MNTEINEPVDRVTSAPPGAQSRRLKTTMAAAAVGLAAAAAIGGLVMTQAVNAADAGTSPSASSTAAASTAPAASTASAASTAPAANKGSLCGRGAGGPHETVTDTSVVANAIGISEADLITALNGGQTPADVAKANNVDVQVVIDALVKDGEQELADQVSAGTITQAQADAQKAAVTQRATDQVNGTLNTSGRRDHVNDDSATPSSSPSTNG